MVCKNQCGQSLIETIFMLSILYLFVIFCAEVSGHYEPKTRFSKWHIYKNKK